MRGFIYTIEKQRFWMMGGARSIDITDGLFDKEDPLLKEKILNLKRQGKIIIGSGVLTGFLRRCLQKRSWKEGWSVCGKWDGDRLYHYPWGACHGVKLFSAWRFKTDELTDYFEKIRKKAQFKRWFCGHYHMDENLVVEGKNFQILYNKIERIY